MVTLTWTSVSAVAPRTTTLISGYLAARTHCVIHTLVKNDENIF